MLPENDLIVFRRGMYATYGKKVRYFVEKKLVARTKIAPPAMPRVVVDPAVARNSLRVIQASEGGADNGQRPGGQLATGAYNSDGSAQRRTVLNPTAIGAALSVPPDDRTKVLFDHLLAVAPARESQLT